MEKVSTGHLSDARLRRLLELHALGLPKESAVVRDVSSALNELITARELLEREDAEPVAWLHEIVEPGEAEPMRMLSFSGENPWSHWLEKHRAECVYTCSPLHLHPSSTEAAGRDAEPVTLAECPVGLFRDARTGTLALKTEYGNNEGRIDAYIVDSGEFYWGSAPQTIENQRGQMVYPVAVRALQEQKR